MMIPQQTIKNFQKEILDWYTQNQRDLPWRNLPVDERGYRDPYAILVSEVMLQQTQVVRVIPKYEAWLQKFPSVQILAKAKVADVLTYWSGLGYNRRALNLKKTAEVVVEKYNGVFPSTEKELLALSGIGTYTARALLCFAFNKQMPVVDTNVRKVIMTKLLPELSSMLSMNVFLKDEQSKDKNILDEKEIQAIAEVLLPHERAYEWNQALMDYSREVLKKEKIIIPKQSKFVGSRRYYRGQIVKILIVRKKVNFMQLGKLLRKDYDATHAEWLGNLIEEMVKEKFIEYKNGFITLAS